MLIFDWIWDPEHSWNHVKVKPMHSNAIQKSLGWNCNKYEVCELLKHEEDHPWMRGSIKYGWFDNL